MDVGNLISGSSAFSKSSLNIWKFLGHVLLKLSLENFEHYFTSVWDESNCVVNTCVYVGVYGAYAYVCMYAYVYICMYVCICVCAYVNTYVCICICECTCIFTQAAVRGYCCKWSSIVITRFTCHLQERCPNGMIPPPIISANFGVTWSLTREVTSTDAFVKSLNWKVGEERGRAPWRGPSEVTPGSFHNEVNPGAGGWEWHFRTPPRPVLLWELIQTSSSIHMFTRYWGMSGLQRITIHHPWSPVSTAGGRKHMKLYTGGEKCIKSQKRALFRFQRWLGNLNNLEVGLVKPKEPVNAVIKKKKKEKQTHPWL